MLPAVFYTSCPRWEDRLQKENAYRAIISNPSRGKIVEELEIQLRKKLNLPHVNLLLRYQKSEIFSSDGKLKFELTGFVWILHRTRKPV